MNVFVLYPVHNKTTMEILAQQADCFVACHAFFRSQNVNVAFMYEDYPDREPELRILVANIRKLSPADVVVCCPGYQSDTTSRSLHMIAQNYKKQIYHFTGKELVAQ